MATHFELVLEGEIFGEQMINRLFYRLEGGLMPTQSSVEALFQSQVVEHLSLISHKALAYKRTGVATWTNDLADLNMQYFTTGVVGQRDGDGLPSFNTFSVRQIRNGGTARRDGGKRVGCPSENDMQGQQLVNPIFQLTVSVVLAKLGQTLIGSGWTLVPEVVAIAKEADYVYRIIRQSDIAAAIFTKVGHQVSRAWGNGR